MEALEIDTPHGRARAHVQPAGGAPPVAALVLGHGAGGSVSSPDLTAAAAAAGEVGCAVALVEQPYRVAGRRSGPRAPALDAAWTAVVEQLTDTSFHGLPLIVGGRSAGARVACRTVEATRAAAVLCLAFPLHPPGGRPSRQPELDAVAVPTLVVQGDRDPFGLPPDGPNRTVVAVPGTHRLANRAAVGAAVTAWLRDVQARLLAPPPVRRSG